MIQLCLGSFLGVTSSSDSHQMSPQLSHRSKHEVHQQNDGRNPIGRFKGQMNSRRYNNHDNNDDEDDDVIDIEQFHAMIHPLEGTDVHSE